MAEKDRDNRYSELKRKIRRLKKLELKIRFGSQIFIGKQSDLLTKLDSVRLVWNDFFDLHSGVAGKVKYPLDTLEKMSKEQYKEIVGEFFFNVYFRYYKENGIMEAHLYDPDILVQMGLPYDADAYAIKKRFRELVKKYHPDAGGDSAKFIEVMENYKKLIE